jgi:hypothetical protein
MEWLSGLQRAVLRAVVVFSAAAQPRGCSSTKRLDSTKLLDSTVTGRE